MAIFVVVELIDGTQSFHEKPYDGFLWAKGHEDCKRNSVEYLAICDDDIEGEDLIINSTSIFRGQELRHMLRALDVKRWIKTIKE